MRKSYKLTMTACFIGFITQAISINLPPLLFVMFMKEFGLTLSDITTLISFTFIVQLIIDIVVSKLMTNKNARFLAITAQASAVLGLVCLAVLPNVMANKFLALLISAFFYSSGSGFVEVAFSPIVEACPNENKSAAMSLLHSFYCWGSAFTIGLTTLFFAIFGTKNWSYIVLFWALIPAIDTLLTSLMPIGDLEADSKQGKHPLKRLTFYIMFGLMLLGGAAELSVSQWASTFAETGLKVSKATGDIAGPFMFAILMGSGRVIYSILGGKVKLINYMLVSGALLTVGFLLSAFSPYPLLSLAGIALCGAAVAIFWPGTLSLAAERLGSSTQLFGILAFAGDIGCTIGPLAIGAVSQNFGDSISAGLTFALIFPIGIMLTSLVLKFRNSK